MLRRRRPGRPARPRSIEIVEEGTGVEHRVDERAHDAGISAGRGLFTALCDRVLVSASLTAEPRSRCRAWAPCPAGGGRGSPAPGAPRVRGAACPRRGARTPVATAHASVAGIAAGSISVAPLILPK